jgi:hypothetical protein
VCAATPIRSNPAPRHAPVPKREGTVDLVDRGIEVGQQIVEQLFRGGFRISWNKLQLLCLYLSSTEV